MDGEIFLMPQSHHESKRKFISDDRTYLLALDGDTDFQPKAVILLVDRSVSQQSFLSYRDKESQSKMSIYYIAVHFEIS